MEDFFELSAGEMRRVGLRDVYVVQWMFWRAGVRPGGLGCIQDSVDPDSDWMHLEQKRLVC